MIDKTLSHYRILEKLGAGGVVFTQDVSRPSRPRRDPSAAGRALATCFLRSALLLSSILAAGCASSQPAARPSGACRGTLGVETGPITRELRKRLALPDESSGAVVTEVLAGGPGAAAGLRPGDIVEQIGGARISNECEFIDAAYGRSCDPVRLTVRRGGEVVAATLIPVAEEPFFEKACGAGVPSGCFRQAWKLWSRGGSRDRALEVYGRACRAGSAEACAYEGLHLTDIPERRDEALPVLKRGCELASGAGCAHLAFLYATGKIVARDDRRATSLYVRACDLGDARGCYNVGLMAEEGRGGPADLALAVRRYREACDSGSSTACTNLGFHFENGRGVEKDAARALMLYERGCAGTRCQPSNLGGCVNVGRAWRDGIGVAKNPAKAATIFEEACGRKLESDDVEFPANSSRACSLLGGLYLAGDGVEKDPIRGRELSETGCARGDSFGCYNAAVVFTSGLGIAPDPEKAAAFLDRACEGGDAEGCHDLGRAYEKGSGVPRDRVRAAALLRKSCGLGFSAACPVKKNERARPRKGSEPLPH